MAADMEVKAGENLLVRGADHVDRHPLPSVVVLVGAPDPADLVPTQVVGVERQPAFDVPAFVVAADVGGADQPALPSGEDEVAEVGPGLSLGDVEPGRVSQGGRARGGAG